MKQERRRFTREFKLNAVELSYSRSNVVELANELQLRPELLYRWRSEFASYQGKSFPGNGKPKMTEQETEIARLKKELKEMQMERDILKKRSASFQERWEIYGFITVNSSRFPIEMMCKVLGVRKSGYYSWLKRKPSKRAIEQQELIERIRQIHKKSKYTYGSPRITE